MSDDEKMYIKLFNRILRIIAELQEIRRQTEFLYIKNLETDDDATDTE